MKPYFLVLLVILALIVADSTAELHGKRKTKKHRRRRPSTESSLEANDNDLKDSSQQDVYSMMEQDEQAQDALRETEARLKQESLARENERARESVRDKDAGGEITDNTVPMYQDPCARVHCGAGRVCSIDEAGEPECVCIETCPVETESRRMVCSNHNETWTSDCAVYQQRCWCDSADDRCKGLDYHHVHIEYYGECREMPNCIDEEMADFPRRMRDWLFNIMRDLADREELTPHYLKMEREAETNMTRRWANAAIWKWCDLDGHPHDRSISRHELFPIRAPLMSLEHCMAPFLDSCDTNNDHHITLTEWGKCLEIEEEELEDRCEEIQSAHDV